jgi:UDP-N-acetylmuramyl pentapeptide phosphotransferase/UDP-N-acetylglucosamine-1-phosphate transferase
LNFNGAFLFGKILFQKLKKIFMKNPMLKVFGKFRHHYYYQEMVQLSTLAVVCIIAWLIISFTDDVVEFASSPKGVIWVLALVAALVLGLTIKLFYNILMIRYSKDPFKYKLLQKD